MTVDDEKPGVDSRDDGKRTERNDLLFTEKVMLMDEQVSPRIKNETPSSNYTIFLSQVMH